MFWSIGSLGDCVRRVIALAGVWWVGGWGVSAWRVDWVCIQGAGSL